MIQRLNDVVAKTPISDRNEEAMALPEVGSKPHACTLPNQDGKNINLADYAGRNVLIWFFPRAFGGG